MTEEKRKIELKYSNSCGRSGEIYSEVLGGRKHYFMTVEIDEETAKIYLKSPEEFIKTVDGKVVEWERDRKTL